MVKNIPNLLTIFRIFLIPVLVVAFYLDGRMAHWVASGIFIFASITDYFDGMLARRLDAQSEFGRMLDPIADKLLVASAIVMLVHLDTAPLLPCLAILCREILVSGLREYLAAFKVSIPVSKLGKIKTGVQMTAITVLILGEKGTGIRHIDYLGSVALWLAAILTLITGYAYLSIGLKHINSPGSLIDVSGEKK